jgi:hypothetical protein
MGLARAVTAVLSVDGSQNRQNSVLTSEILWQVGLHHQDGNWG